MFFLFSVIILQEQQDLSRLPSPLEIVIQASQQTHYFAQDDGVGHIEKLEEESMPFSSFLNMISYNQNFDFFIFLKFFFILNSYS